MDSLTIYLVLMYNYHVPTHAMFIIAIATRIISLVRRLMCAIALHLENANRFLANNIPICTFKLKYMHRD